MSSAQRARAGRTQLHDLADNNPGRVEIETVDICEPEQIAALRARLSGRVFDILFVNAGTANRNPNESIGEVSTEEFIRVMVTNALGPMRAVEALQNLVPADGLIGIMSSGQGSIANNTKGGFEVYRGSKSALNQYMRSYAARHAGDRRALLLMAPGWIRTELGGPHAPFSLEETVPDIVNVLLSTRGTPGLQFLDRKGKAVPW
jgi:NAD(P)-dependent dehydrogenase (short-subunit alcohol dehydrogenase family)